MGALRYLFGLAVILLLQGAVPAHAQVAIQSITALALGNVSSAASGNTIFTVTPSTGAVTKTGNGARITTTVPVRATVTIRCTGSTAVCNAGTINVRVGNGGAGTGRALTVTNLTAASGTATLVAAPTPGDPITFQISPIPRNSNRTFYVGGDITITGDDGGGTTGAATIPINVRVAIAPATPATPGTTSNATATVYRSLSVTKTSDLGFGKIVKPTSSTNTYTINAGTGALTRTGTGNAVQVGAATRSTFSLTGEAGRVVSVVLSPATTLVLTRSGGAQTLNVTLSRSPTGTITLTGGVGTLNIGGALTVGTTTTTGDYSGTLNVTFNYN